MNKKKKAYFVKCSIDDDEHKEQTVIVKAENPYIATQKAEAVCRNSGYFQAKAIYCNEMEA